MTDRLHSTMKPRASVVKPAPIVPQPSEFAGMPTDERILQVLLDIDDKLKQLQGIGRHTNDLLRGLTNDGRG